MEHSYRSFCFAELHAPDVDGATRFYGELFGWQGVHHPITGDYFTFQLQGNDVIALRRTSPPQRLVGYVRVENVDSAAARAKALGATVAIPAFDTPGFARTCVLEDPEGAMFCIMRPNPAPP